MAKPDEAPLKKAKKKKAKKVKLKDAGNEPAGPKGSLKRRREENGGQDAASPKKKVKTLKTAGDAAKKKKKKKAKKDKNAAKTAEEKSYNYQLAQLQRSRGGETQRNDGRRSRRFPGGSADQRVWPGRRGLSSLFVVFRGRIPRSAAAPDWGLREADADPERMLADSHGRPGHDRRVGNRQRKDPRVCDPGDPTPSSTEPTTAATEPGRRCEQGAERRDRPCEATRNEKPFTPSPPTGHAFSPLHAWQAVSPRMLILAPTRELATQCEEVLVSGLAGAGVSVVCTYGGVPKHQQLRRLQKGARSPNGVVVVATPGRLRDLENDGGLVLDAVEYLVLDEADRMLDLGFERDVKAIIANCMPPPERQTVMFSATWPESIRQLAATFLNNPVKITVGTDELTSNHRVQQTVEVIAERDRFQRLRELLNRYHRKKNNRILVFALYKKEAARLESMLQREFRCNSVHGDKSQPERSRAVDDFRNKDCPLLIATDVAARGLDIPDVEVVINYSFPLTIEDYIHRIGRTGRAGKTGVSHTFFHDGNKQLAGSLMNVLREADQEVPSELMRFGAGVKKKEHKLYGAFAADVDMTKKPKKIIFD
eukprot:scaffold7660_cov200-Pinguiococcus_pyrenoidosus.AAC.2